MKLLSLPWLIDLHKFTRVRTARIFMALSLKFKIMHAYYLTRITVSLAGLHIVCIDSYNFAIRIRIFFPVVFCWHFIRVSVSIQNFCVFLPYILVLSLVWFGLKTWNQESRWWYTYLHLCVYLAFYVCTIGLMKPSNTLE